MMDDENDTDSVIKNEILLKVICKKSLISKLNSNGKVSQTKISPPINPSVSNESPGKAFLSSSLDCNLDQILTKLTTNGKILWIDTNQFRNANNSSSNELQLNNNNSSYKKLKNSSGVGEPQGGLLLDIKNLKSIKIFDYVHTNDLNHVHKHFSDGIAFFNIFYFYFNNNYLIF